MPGDTCIVCGHTRRAMARDSTVSFHRFPTNPVIRSRWIRLLELDESKLKSYSKICSKHFPGGDAKQDPQLALGKRFASPKKPWTPRAKRARKRQANEQSGSSSSKSRSATPILSSISSPPCVADVPVSTVVAGEQLDTNYEVTELPTDSSVCSDSVSDVHSSSAVSCTPRDSSEVLVNTALLARVEALEAENHLLKKKQQKQNREYFRISHIKHDDRLVRFYTGFISFMVLQAFYDFLGPVVNKLNYWGTKQGHRSRHRPQKLNPLNQLFLLLVKLRLNLRNKDLAFRFGISTSAVSRYITTWICFLYHHLREIEWMPSVNQVTGTLPHAFKDRFPTTYAIIDGSEIFLETPSDLHMQSSTWSQYKHHNTAKFLVACTPNGAVAYISPLYVGSISDVELTRISGFLTKLEDKPGISIMADRGFTIKDLLSEIGVKLNIPPFMEGRQQLPAEEVQKGRKIASLRIHVERCIGRIKTFSILTGTMPISMARLSNHIVCICGYLSNFLPALVPPPSLPTDSSVEEYFQTLSDTDEGYTADSDDSYDTNSDD